MFYRLIQFFLMVLLLPVMASPIQERRLDPIALSDLGVALGIGPDVDFIQETQKRWLRKPGLERWEVQELSSDQKALVLDWAEKQGMFDSWKPLYKSYDKALILGATTSRMQMRLNYLIQLWNQGIRFHEVVWLTGDRPLDPRVDGLTDRCTTESGASHILWEETDLPEEMGSVRVHFVEVPMKEGGKRPNTEDTIVAWLRGEPKACTALFVSDQPFCGYQYGVIKGSLPGDVQFDVVGQGVSSRSHPASAAITLDSIARWIYQESLCKNSVDVKNSF